MLVATVVEEDVAFGPENMGGAAGGDPPAGWTRRCRSVGMYEFREHALPTSFPGGQKQRVAVAGVIAMQSPLYRCWTSRPPCWTPAGRRGGARQRAAAD